MDYNYTSDAASTGSTAASSVVLLGTSLIVVVLLVIAIMAMWKTFTKAGKPGWASIIPIYSNYVLIKISKHSGWWLLLLLIPVVNVIVTLVIAIDVAKAFGRSSTFGVFGLWLFGVIGYLILGFGKSQYIDAPATAPVQH